MSAEYATLISDGSSFMRKMIGKLLEGTEFNIVAQAGDGAEAVELFEQHQPAVVLLDLVMPNMTGDETLTRILELKPDTIVFMVSSVGSEEMLCKCLESGASGFIQKPFDQDLLLVNLRRALSEKEGAS